jgi:hypothetical protein
MMHVLFRIALALLLFVESGRAFASDGSKSGDSSGNSSDGSSDSNSNSDGSNRSSDNSGESSKNSGDSSKNSDGSSERSSENSTKDSSDESSDGSKESSKSNAGKTISVAGAIIVLGASVLGGIALTADAADEAKSAELLLERFLKRHHPALARDVVLAKGPVLDSIARDLGLSGAEAKRFFAALDGSAEQTAMLESIAGRIDDQQAQLFAAQMCAVVERALGTERMKLAAHHAIKRRV